MSAINRGWNRRSAGGARRTLLYIGLIFFALVSIGPILLVISTAFKSNAELAVNPLGLPRAWDLDNFVQAWNVANIGRYAINSILVTVPTLVIVLLSASLAGYAFATMTFRGRGFFFVVILVGLTIPPVSIVTSLSLLEQNLGLYNSLPGLVAAESALCMPLAVFIMRSAFRDLPPELREAVFVDGGNNLTAFFRVLLPLARPALSAVAVLTFLTTWNDYLFPLVLINTESLRTIPLGLADLQSGFIANVVVIAAATTLGSVPSVLIYAVFQRQFVSGIAQGSIK